MMGEYDLPVAVEIGGELFKIRNQCDYRIVLQCIRALNDTELSEEQRIQCAIIIFYEDYDQIKDLQTAVSEMFRIIGYNEEPSQSNDQHKPQLMDWEKDFRYIAPPISRILGYDVRLPGQYTHWWTFLSGYMEIGECTFSTIVTIRSKKAKGKKLEKWEEEFYRENYEMIRLPQKYTKEEQAVLSLFE